MKNPFYRNFIWLGIISAITGIVLFISCTYDCRECFVIISSLTQNIIIGFFSSSILLLLNELVNFFADRNKYGFLEGTYSRKIIADILELQPDINKKRTDELTSTEIEILLKRGFEPIPDSKYIEIIGYREIGKEWRIKLKYLHNGTYEGIADYHAYWLTYGTKTTVRFTLTLNTSNITTGSGNYKYLDKDDYGIYSFYVNGEARNEILVTYYNTIPSGLAQGYEKWERIN
jgi:hypothetical protein